MHQRRYEQTLTDGGEDSHGEEDRANETPFVGFPISLDAQLQFLLTLCGDNIFVFLQKLDGSPIPIDIDRQWFVLSIACRHGKSITQKP